MKNLQKNLLIEKIINNSKNYSKLKIISDYKNSVNFSELINLALSNTSAIANIKNDYIPILIDRNIDSVLAILSVILSKKAFCPISSSFPNERINNIFKILGTKKFINCSKKKISLPANFEEIKINKINSLNKMRSKKSFILPSLLQDPKQTFYVLFTSGSTGAPKGVKLSYSNIYNTLMWSKKYLSWKDQKIGIATQFSFDISMFDLFSCLFFKVPTFILSDPANPFKTYKEIQGKKITSIFSVPTFFSSFAKFKLLNKKIKLKRIISGGDFFPPKDILLWKNNTTCKIINVWGPTETSIVNTMYKISNKDNKNLLLGKNLPVGISERRMEINVLKNKKIVKNNTIGEICMSGNCVASGYLGHIKNKKNFIKLKGKRSYLTGDNGYFDKKGFLYILGRKDNTIKISGYRVDALELQNLVNKMPDVSNSIALSIKKDGINILTLAIETHKNISIEKIKNKLKINLPSYSIPKQIEFFKKFPLNPNSKIDRKKIIKLFNDK